MVYFEALVLVLLRGHHPWMEAVRQSKGKFIASLIILASRKPAMSVAWLGIFALNRVLLVRTTSDFDQPIIGQRSL